MTAASSWIFTIFITSLICAILEFLVSDTSLNKIIKSVLGIFFLTSIIIPIKKIKIPKIKYNFENQSTNLNNKLENRTDLLAKENIKKEIIKFLALKSIKVKNIIIYIDKNYKANCEISFYKGVDNTKKIINLLKDNFQIDFYLKNN